MNGKDLYVIDISFKQQKVDLSENIANKSSEILSLTPYSSYLLEAIGKEYFTFHNIVSETEFSNIVIGEYEKIEKVVSDYRDYSFLFRDFAIIKTVEVYLKILFEYFDKKKLDNYNIIYLTDRNKSTKMNITNNASSYIYKYSNIDEVINITNKDISFYRFNSIRLRMGTLRHRKNIISKFFNRCADIMKNNMELYYDNKHFKKLYKGINEYSIKRRLSIDKYNDFCETVIKVLNSEGQIQFISDKYISIMEDCRNNITKHREVSTVEYHPFTFLTNMKNYVDVLVYKINGIPKIFMQHGSYTREDMFLKYNEIYPADINIVFNDYTKALFEKRGATKVYSVGSIDFNYSINEKPKRYDYLYITYCTSYSYIGTYISQPSDSHSVDAADIYERHRLIIELFGTRFKDKTICIKVQPGVFTGDMLYVPLEALSKNYENVKIEYVTPIPKLIERSIYIISDYLSSDFINRKLHCMRDIILYKGAPSSIPDELVEDMEKMYIIIDSVDDLSDVVENILEITKNRQREDDIIEFYSSKKCDTKNRVTEIVVKETSESNQ